MKRIRWTGFLVAVCLMGCLFAGCQADKGGILTADGQPLPDDANLAMVSVDYIPTVSFEDMASRYNEKKFVAIVEMTGKPQTVAVEIPPVDEIDAAKRGEDKVYRLYTYVPARVKETLVGSVEPGYEFTWVQYGCAEDLDGSFQEFMYETKVKRNKSYLVFAQPHDGIPDHYRSSAFDQGWFEIAGNHVKTYSACEWNQSLQNARVEDVVAQINQAYADYIPTKE
nr:hypothetical protein [bacterium]